MPGPSLYIRQNCPIATPANDGLMSAAQAAAIAAGGSTLGTAYVAGGGNAGVNNTLGDSVGTAGMTSPLIMELQPSQVGLQISTTGGSASPVATLGLNGSGEPILAAEPGYSLLLDAGPPQMSGGNGNAVVITASDGVGGNSNGGPVNIQVGAPVGSGSPGMFNVASAAGAGFGLDLLFNLFPVIYGTGGEGLFISGQVPSPTQLISTGFELQENGVNSSIAHRINGTLTIVEELTAFYPSSTGSSDSVIDLGAVAAPDGSGPGRWRRVTGNQFVASQATPPTVTPGTGAGVSATTTLARASDTAMLLTIVTGATGLAAGILASIVPFLAYPAAPIPQISAANAAAATLMSTGGGVYANEATVSTILVPIASAVAPILNTTYKFYITIFGT